MHVPRRGSGPLTDPPANDEQVLEYGAGRIHVNRDAFRITTQAHAKVHSATRAERIDQTTQARVDGIHVRTSPEIDPLVGAVAGYPPHQPAGSPEPWRHLSHIKRIDTPELFPRACVDLKKQETRVRAVKRCIHDQWIVLDLRIDVVDEAATGIGPRHLQCRNV